MRILPKEKVYAVVKLNCDTYDFSAPRYGAYHNKHIIKIALCVRIGGQLFDVRTAEKIDVTDNRTLVWRTGSGVYEYPDGRMFLLTKKFADGNFLLMNIGKKDYNKMSMVYHKLK